MRQIIKDYVAIAARLLPLPDPIYEFGALQVEGQEGFADLRPLFPGRPYVGCDMRAGLGVDRVVNLHALDLPNDSVGTALLLETLEHVEFCREAVAEVWRVLAPGGVVVASSVMNFVIHEYPHDYWRFTPEGFKSLFQRFETVHVDWAGEENHPHTVVATACKGSLPPAAVAAFCAAVERWRARASAGPKVSLGQRLLPPVLYRLDRKIVKRLRAAGKR
jgi:SAM-dependent methyltransferase